MFTESLPSNGYTRHIIILKDLSVTAHNLGYLECDDVPMGPHVSSQQVSVDYTKLLRQILTVILFCKEP
jgi:hypothetical protein